MKVRNLEVTGGKMLVTQAQPRICLIDRYSVMPNKGFWKKTNAAAAKAVRSAKGQPNSALKRDWKPKQASRTPPEQMS